jgi:hypothetical protein
VQQRVQAHPRIVARNRCPPNQIHPGRVVDLQGPHRHNCPTGVPSGNGYFSSMTILPSTPVNVQGTS